jgi:hypothetical protein
VFVLLTRGIYGVLRSDGLRSHDIYVAAFVEIYTSVKAILRFCLRNLRGCKVGICDGRDL